MSTAKSGARRTVVTVLAIQVVMTSAVALIALLIADGKAAYSALVGGGINVFATAHFARRAFSLGSGATAESIARAFYLGEVMKFVLTVLLFSAVLLLLEVSFPPLFIAYAVTMLAFWIALPFTL